MRTFFLKALKCLFHFGPETCIFLERSEFSSRRDQDRMIETVVSSSIKFTNIRPLALMNSKTNRKAIVVFLSTLIIKILDHKPDSCLEMDKLT